VKRLPLEIGSEIEGKVTGITNYGAFIEMPEGCSGLVHISQVADAYVTDISKHIKIGDLIKVKIMGMAKEGKYDLSIKQVGKQAWQQPRRKTREEKEQAEPGSFEDKITQFLKQSEDKLQDWKRNLESKQGGGRKKF
jgi:S1 RNA binding domain protein